MRRKKVGARLLGILLVAALSAGASWVLRGGWGDGPEGFSTIDREGGLKLLAMSDEGTEAFRAGRYDLAAEIFEGVLAGLPPARRATTAAALLGVGSGSDYRRLLSGLHGNLGLSYLRSRRYELAISALGHAVALSPRAVQPRINLGLAQLHVKRFGDAVRSFDRAIALEPGDAKLHLDLGRALLGAGDLPRARWASTQAVRLAGHEASVASWGTGIEGEKLLAEVDLRDRQSVRAERRLRSVLERVPGEVQARYRLIQLLERTERIEEAEAERRRFTHDSELLGTIQSVLISDPGGIDALLWVADTYRQLGLLHLAEVHYEQLVARNPNDTKAVWALHDLKIRMARASSVAAGQTLAGT